MAQKLKWKVIREHTGDRFYPEGDTRIGTKADLGHLEGKLLELIGEDDALADEPAAEPVAAKAEDEPQNKAETAAPANKADRQRASKRK